MRTARSIRPVFALLLAVIGLTVGGCKQPIEKRWEYWASGACLSTPAVTDELVIFGTDNGEVHAVNKAGKHRWKFQTRRKVVSALLVADKLVFFGSTNKSFYAIDLNGKEVWKYTTLDRIIRIDEDIRLATL